MKKIAVGQEVIVVQTGEKARVTEYFDDTWIVIRAGKKEMHVRREEIEVLGDEQIITQENNAGRFTQSTFATEGIALVFRQVNKMNGETHYFEVHLVNHTPHHLLFDYQFLLAQIVQYGFKKEIRPHGEMLLHEMKTDQLNDHPVFHVVFWLNTAQHGLRSEFEKEVRLRPKQFFSKTAAPQFGRDGYFSIELFPSVPKEEEEKSVVPVAEIKDADDLSIFNEVIEKANLPDHIDLHAEKLLPAHELMTASEILEFQLRTFRHFLESAIRLGLHKVYAVHGIGKGTLKNEIARLLEQYPDVVSFNNHYHSRFGYGATEIWLA